MSEAMSRAAKKLRIWRENPVQFVRDEFNAEPDPLQAEVLMAFPHEQRIAMKASKGPGKTTTLSWCAWNFLATRPHPKIAATSISGDNLSDNLWSEMSKWQQRSPFLREAFRWTKTRIESKEYPQTWWMSARQWPKTGDATQQADTLAGLHADYILFVLDETGAMPDAVMASAEAALATGIEAKLIQAGNPTNLSGPLYRACHQERGIWFVVEMTGDPDDPKRSPRVSVEWARQQIAKYGKDNPWVLVNVFGKFPPASMNSLFPEHLIEDAMKRVLRPEEYTFMQSRLGVDVARFGDDRTMLFHRQGRFAGNQPLEMRNARTNEIATAVTHAKQNWKTELEYVDDTGGWGAGVIDQLILLKYSPVPVNFSGKANDPRYLNKRAEMYFLFSEWMKNGVLPRSDNLKKELLAIWYMYTNNKFQIADKDQIKEQLGGHSPDEADAAVLTFAHPDVEGQLYTAPHGAVGNRSHRALTEWNPFEDRILA